jgi:phage terminase large subunit-like protein
MLAGPSGGLRSNVGRRDACGRLRHDGDPVPEWCLSNVVGKAGRRGNLYPPKLRTGQEIDAAIVLMMAVGRAMTEDEAQAGLGRFLDDPIS